MKTLKVLLIILLVLQAVAGGWMFISALSQSILYALIFLFITVLQIALTVAVILHCNDLENVWYEIERLRYAVREVQNTTMTDEEITYSAENPAELARNTWECIKCGTVNKADTTHCDHCGAAYDATVYPTDDPSVKRKMSRWVKENKKRSFGSNKANS